MCVSCKCCCDVAHIGSGSLLPGDFLCCSHRFGMFSIPPRVSESASVASVHFRSSDAAHCPVQPGTSGSTLPPSNGFASLPPWYVGEPEYDEFMAELGIAPDILRRFAELDHQARLNISRSTFKTKPEHPNPWMEKCIARSLEDRDKRRGQPYRRGASCGNSPKAGAADSSPAS